jgi:hypothetical protein
VSYDGVLVHSARPVAYVAEQGPSIEGDQGIDQVIGAAFPCCLFMPLPGEANRRGRTVVEPLVLLPGNIHVSRSERLLITAPELTGPAPVEWQIQGVQPFGKPGQPLVGKQATLRRVEDGG